MFDLGAYGEAAANFLGKLSVRVVFGIFCVTAILLFTPLKGLVENKSLWLVVVFFVFSLAWLAVAIVEAYRSYSKARADELLYGISGLRTDILMMLDDVERAKQELLRHEDYPEIAAKVSAKYARLKLLKVATPDISLQAEYWDFEFHKKYLVLVSTLLEGGSVVHLRSEAKKFLRSESN